MIDRSGIIRLKIGVKLVKNPLAPDPSLFRVLGDIEIIHRLGKKTVAGGPLFNGALEEYMPLVDHLVLNEAELTLPPFLAFPLALGLSRDAVKRQRVETLEERSAGCHWVRSDPHIRNVRVGSSQHASEVSPSAFSASPSLVSATASHRGRSFGVLLG